MPELSQEYLFYMIGYDDGLSGAVMVDAHQLGLGRTLTVDDQSENDRIYGIYKSGYEKGRHELLVAARIVRIRLGSDEEFLKWLNQ